MSSLQAGVKRDSTRIDFQFVALPSEILRRNDLSDGAKLLVSVLLDNSRSRGGRCRFSNATLASLLGKSASSVKRLLSELTDAGLVVVETIAGGRVRTGIRPTWVAQDRATDGCSVAQECTAHGSDSIQGVAQDRSTNQTPGSEPLIRPEISLSDSGEKTSDADNRIATPEETALFLRALVRGGKPTLPAPVTDAHAPRSNAPSRSTPTIAPLPSPTPIHMPTLPGSGNAPDIERMAYNVAFSARAAAYRPAAPRKTADQQIAELKRRTAERERLQAAT